MAQLERTLSFPAILLITINSILGAGIFFLPSISARMAGPSAIISWIILIFISLGISLIFAELVGMYPKSGGVYEYTKQAFGPFVSFLVGWMTLIAANITIAMLVIGAVRYLNPSMPQLLSILISIALIVVFNFLAYRGVQLSATILVIFGIVTIVAVLGLTIPGLFHFSAGNFRPFWTVPFSTTLLTVFFIAETFFGWETATFLAEEVKDPERVMPKAMWLSTLIIAVLVLGFVIVSLGNIGWQSFGSSVAPLADLSARYFGAGSVAFISIIVYLVIIGSVAGWIISTPRLLMSLAADKLFIAQFAEVHEEFHTPYKAIMLQTVLTSIIIIISAGSYENILHLLLPVALVLYCMVVFSFLVLRVKQPTVTRPFKVPWGVALGIGLLAAITCLITMWLFLTPGALQTLSLIVSFAALGIPVFLLLIFYYDPDAVIRITGMFAYFSLLFENMILPRRVRREILLIFKNLESKHVLEYGAGVGTLTLQLADKVGPRGKVTATDFSKKNIEILRSRLRRRGITHVSVIHDPHQVSRIHPDVAEVDIVFSVGMLSYIQDVRKVLRDVRRILPDDGKICLVDYVDYFRILPNPEWINDHAHLKQLFWEEGFQVEIATVHGIFWNYLFIYGQKRRQLRKDVPYI